MAGREASKTPGSISARLSVPEVPSGLVTSARTLARRSTGRADSVNTVCRVSVAPGSQLLWTTYTLYSRGNKSALPSATVQAGVYAVSALILLPLALFERPWVTLPRAGWAGWGAVLYAAAFGTVSHIWYYQCLRVVGAGRAAVFTNLTPFVVIVLSALTLGEAIRWYHLVGATVVLAGVVLATTK